MDGQAKWEGGSATWGEYRRGKWLRVACCYSSAGVDPKRPQNAPQKISTEQDVAINRRERLRRR